MKKTDYSKIAIKYDNNEYRKNIDLDVELLRSIESNNIDGTNVLDLSCGTGIYLAKQIEYLSEYRVNWYAIDASQEMIDIAKSKINNAIFNHGMVEDMPYKSGFFHYISNNFAFHHYSDKEMALDEICRVLIKNGVYKMHNIGIHDMKKWWIYEFFPSAYEEDVKRFWDNDLIFQELTKRGFDVKLQMNYKKETTKVTEFIEHARNKDISVLTLISESDYKAGIEKMEQMIQLDYEATIVNDFAIIDVISTKR